MKKLIPLAVLSMLPCLQLLAQEGKLKNIQTSSVWAPASVKVDGSLKEWDDTFQAYNKTTSLFYTVCNDDKYIYFVVKSIDVPNNAKIIAGGITLTLNTDGKKKEKDAFSLTYPIIPRTPRGQGGGRQGGGGGRQGGGRGAPPDSAAVAAQHKQTISAAKEIKVSGFKDITDTLISIYNEFGIKAGIGYDPLGNYDYELAVPLKALNLSVNDAKDIAYNVKVNGISIPAGFGGGDGGNGGGGLGAAPGAPGGDRGGNAGGRGGRAGGGAPGEGGGGGPGGGRNLEMFSPTDFWGKYTLAKK